MIREVAIVTAAVFICHDLFVCIPSTVDEGGFIHSRMVPSVVWLYKNNLTNWAGRHTAAFIVFMDQ